MFGALQPKECLLCFLFFFFFGFLQWFVSAWLPPAFVIQLIKHMSSESNCVSDARLEHTSRLWIAFLWLCNVPPPNHVGVRWRTFEHKWFTVAPFCLSSFHTFRFRCLLFPSGGNGTPCHEDSVSHMKTEQEPAWLRTDLDTFRTSLRTEVASVLCFFHLHQHRVCTTLLLYWHHLC